jgi:hypothetical protein
MAVELSFQMEAPAVPGTVIQVRVTPSPGHVRASVHPGGAQRAPAARARLPNRRSLGGASR